MSLFFGLVWQAMSTLPEFAHMDCATWAERIEEYDWTASSGVEKDIRVLHVSFCTKRYLKLGELDGGVEN